MKNTNKKFISGILGIFMLFGLAPMSFAGTPILTINPNPSLTATSASFSVFYDVNGDILTSVAVQYGTNTLMQSKTSSQNPSQNSGTLTFTANGLSPNTTYYFQAIGVSSASTVTSGRYTFTTKSVQAPTISTKPNPTSITQTSAMLSGFYNDNGFPISNLVFEYGTNSSLGYTQRVSSYGSSGTANQMISGLMPNTKYWYRLSGTNIGGTVDGSIYTFDTASASNNPKTCTINNFSASDYNINYGENVTIYYSTTDCDNKYISDYGAVYNSSDSIIVYPYRDTTYTLTASNSVNSTSKSFTIYVNNNDNNDDQDNNKKKKKPKDDDCFFFGSCKPTCSYFGNCKTTDDYVTATTTYVKEASPTSATFVGTVYTNGASSYGSFEYGTTIGLGKITPKLSSNGGSNTNFAYTVYNLKPNTTYYFRIVGESNKKVSVGDILYFKTPSQGSIITTVDTKNTNTKDTSTVNNTTKNNSSSDESNEKNSSERNSDGSFLTAGAGFSGSFFPGTVLGWILVAICILILILIIKKVFPRENKTNTHQVH